LWPLLPLTFVICIAAMVSMVMVQRWRVRRMGGSDSAADLSVNQKRVFLLDMPM
jgi:hypothetical protein